MGPRTVAGAFLLARRVFRTPVAPHSTAGRVRGVLEDSPAPGSVAGKCESSRIGPRAEERSSNVVGAAPDADRKRRVAELDLNPLRSGHLFRSGPSADVRERLPLPIERV